MKNLKEIWKKLVDKTVYKEYLILLVHMLIQYLVTILKKIWKSILKFEYIVYIVYTVVENEHHLQLQSEYCLLFKNACISYQILKQADVQSSINRRKSMY